MSGEPIGVGDLVECLHVRGDCAFVVGAVYTVEEVGIYYGHPWINCSGMPRPSDYGYDDEFPGWNAKAFRPISRRSDFESLLASVSEPRDDVTAPTKTPEPEIA